MKKVTIVTVIAVLIMAFLGALIVAQTSGTRPGTTVPDTTRTTTGKQSNMGSMNHGQMMTQLRDVDQRLNTLWPAWQQIYTHYHSMLEITDQQKLKTEMEKHHQMVNDFNRQAGELHEMYVNMQGHTGSTPGMGGTGNTGGTTSGMGGTTGGSRGSATGTNRGRTGSDMGRRTTGDTLNTLDTVNTDTDTLTGRRSTTRRGGNETTRSRPSMRDTVGRDTADTIGGTPR